MKIPTVQQSVDSSIPSVSEVQIPGAVRGAFGEDVAQATEQVGKQVSQVGNLFTNYAIKRNEELSQEKAYEEFTKFSRETQDLLTKPGTKDIQSPDGTTRTINSALLLRPLHDADGSTMEYDQQSTILYKGHTEGMNNETKKIFDRLYNSHNEATRNNVISHEAKQIDEAAKANFFQFKDTVLKDISSYDDKNRLKAINNVNNRIDKLQKAGRFTYEEAQKQRENINTQLFYSSVNIDPQGTIDELSKGTEGIYKNLDPKSRDTLVGEAEKVKEQQIAINAQLRQEALDANEDKLINMKINGKLTPAIVKEWRDNNQITPKFANRLINSLYSSKPIGAKTKNAKFVGFVNDMLYNKVKPKDIELALMEANTTGALSDEDFNALVTFNQDVNKSDKLQKMLPNVSFLKGAMYWGDENAGARDDSKARIFKDYMTQIKQGVNPEVASIQAIRNEVLFLFPQAKTAPEEGIDIIDLNGVIKHITPDGELTIKEAKPKESKSKSK